MTDEGKKPESGKHLTTVLVSAASALVGSLVLRVWDAIPYWLVNGLLIVGLGGLGFWLGGRWYEKESMARTETLAKAISSDNETYRRVSLEKVKFDRWAQYADVGVGLIGIGIGFLLVYFMMTNPSSPTT